MLTITDYLHRTNSWEPLCNYILDYANITVAAGTTPSDLAISWFQKQAKHLIPEEKLYNRIDKKIRDERLGSNNPNKKGGFEFKNETLYPLLYVLNVNEPLDVQHFCRDILHQDELSSRNLEDFLTLCCLKLCCPVAVYEAMLSKYSSEIKSMAKAPQKIVYGVTGEHFDSISSITNIEQMDKYIQNHLSEFSKTRNTRYLMLFDEVGWESWDHEQWKAFFMQYPEHQPCHNNMTEAAMAEFILDVLEYGVTPSMEHDMIQYMHHDEVENKYGNKTIDDCYNRFHLCRNGLSDDQITVLSQADDYKSVFLSPEHYRDIYLQNDATDIPAGVYLLSMITKYYEDEDTPKDKTRPSDIILYEKSDGLLDNVETIGRNRFFTKVDNFLDEVNQELALGGFPPLNRYNLFTKLFIDTFDEIRKENPAAIDFIQIQSLFVERLCFYLKKIADTLSK